MPGGNGSVLAGTIPNDKLVYLERSVHGLIEDVDKVINTVTGFRYRTSNMDSVNQALSACEM